jgi:hypothetical protein
VFIEPFGQISHILGKFFAGILKIFPYDKTVPGESKIQSNAPQQFSAWEKMGLVIGGGNPVVSKLTQIATNTKIMADAVTIREKRNCVFQADKSLPSFA